MTPKEKATELVNTLQQKESLNMSIQNNVL